MEPEEALAAIQCLHDGVKSGYNADEVLHALHEDPTIFDGIWFALDHKFFELNYLETMVDTIGEAAMTIPDKDLRKEWMRDHAFGEMFFFAAWKLYREGKLQRALQACEANLNYNIDHKPTITLMHYINSELTHDPSFPYNHQTLPPLRIKDKRVELSVKIDGAAFKVETDDSWTD